MYTLRPILSIFSYGKVKQNVRKLEHKNNFKAFFYTYFFKTARLSEKLCIIKLPFRNGIFIHTNPRNLSTRKTFCLQ